MKTRIDPKTKKRGIPSLGEKESSQWSLFNCQRCGRCCEEVGLPWDCWKSEEIARFLNMRFDDFFSRYYGKVVTKRGKKYFQLDPDRTTHYPFLGKDKSCQIYPVRPEPCKLFPIETDFGRCGVDCPAMRILDEIESSCQKEEDQMLDKIHLLFQNPEEKGFPHPPFAYVCLSNYATVSFSGREHIVLSPKVLSVRKVEWWADQLIQDLKRVKQDARKRFANANGKWGR